MKKIIVCASCTGVSEHGLMGIMLIKAHGRDLVRLGVVHRPGCPELEDGEAVVEEVGREGSTVFFACPHCGAHDRARFHDSGGEGAGKNRTMTLKGECRNLSCRELWAVKVTVSVEAE